MLCKPRAQISRFMAGSITVMLFYVAQSKITTFHFTILNFSIPAQTFFRLFPFATRLLELYVSLHRSYDLVVIHEKIEMFIFVKVLSHQRCLYI